jgi:hypothetical protein
LAVDYRERPIHVNPPQPTKQEIEEALERICSSRHFASSPRMIRFLRYIVEKSVSGNSADIRELQIGLEVFDRWPTYDPKIDTIVRVEARRLRKKLEEYYRSDGRADRVVIAVPPPGYQPRFRAAGAAEEQAS